VTKIWICGQNLNFWPNFEFLTKIWIFEQILNFWPKYKFWPTFPFLSKISIFGKKASGFTKISIFDANFNPKFPNFPKKDIHLNFVKPYFSAIVQSPIASDNFRPIIRPRFDQNRLARFRLLRSFPNSPNTTPGSTCLSNPAARQTRTKTPFF